MNPDQVQQMKNANQLNLNLADSWLKIYSENERLRTDNRRLVERNNDLVKMLQDTYDSLDAKRVELNDKLRETSPRAGAVRDEGLFAVEKF